MRDIKIKQTGIFLCGGKCGTLGFSLDADGLNPYKKDVLFGFFIYLVLRLRNEGLTKLKKQIGPDQFSSF